MQVTTLAVKAKFEDLSNLEKCFFAIEKKMKWTEEIEVLSIVNNEKDINKEEIVEKHVMTINNTNVNHGSKYTSVKNQKEKQERLLKAVQQIIIIDPENNFGNWLFGIDFEKKYPLFFNDPYLIFPLF